MRGEGVGRLEYELMMLGRHSALAAVGDSAQSPGPRLERSAYVLMSRIELAGPMSIGQLAEAFGLDVSTVNRQTAAMSRAGLVERIPDPDGGIARKFRITPAGLERLHLHRDYLLTGLRRVLAAWTPDEVGDLTRMLARLNASIEEHAP
jgi:DNA-binding MarR family transcriptional regulator